MILRFLFNFFPLSLQLFAEVLIEDPVLVQEIALSQLEVGADEEKKIVRENQLFILDSFSTFLELATLHHRLIEVATESARLARLVGQYCWFSDGDLREVWFVGKK